MPRYYVFATQVEAQACADRIWSRLKAACIAQGYTVDKATGGIIGKDTSGRDVPGALTLAWDTPRQRLDGKWAVLASAAVPGRSFIVAPLAKPPLTLGAILDADDLSASVTIQNDDSSWWPAPPLVVVRT